MAMDYSINSFAIFFGKGIILIPDDKSKPVKAFFDGVNEVILKMIDMIMLGALNVFALLASLIVEYPSLDLFKAPGGMIMCYNWLIVNDTCIFLLVYTITRKFFIFY